MASRNLRGSHFVLWIGEPVSTETVDAHAGERLAHYKRSHEYIVIYALRRTPNGKLRRADLRLEVLWLVTMPVQGSGSWREDVIGVAWRSTHPIVYGEPVQNDGIFQKD